MKLLSIPACLRFCLLLAAFSALPARAGLFDDDEARKRIDQVKADLEDRIQKLEEASRNQLMLANQIEALRAELARLRGQQEVTANDVDQSQKRQKDLYVDLDTRLRKIEMTIADLGQKLATAQSAAAARPAEPPPDPAQESRDYEAAVNALRNGKHVDALVGFRQFIKTWPKSNYLPSAHFWAASAAVQARDLDTATELYNKFIATWPDDAFVPDAMLGLAGCQQDQGDAKAARKTLETLVAKFPKSEAAKTAKQRLSKK